MIFYVFYLLFSFRENVEYAVSEHLESLKFPKKKKRKKKERNAGGLLSNLAGCTYSAPPERLSCVAHFLMQCKNKILLH